MNRLNNKHHIITSKGAEKTFHKHQHPITTKSLHNSDTRELPETDEGHQQKTQSCHTERYPSKTVNKAGRSTLTTPFQQKLDDPSQ